jgi:parvulin-like peptidyl-prolyl isomerase
MKARNLVAAAAAGLLIHGAAHAAIDKSPVSEGPSLAMKAPLFSPLFAAAPAATVNGEPITIKELAEALSSMHGDAQAEGKAPAKKTVAGVINRLVNIRLIRLEAENMGMHELPEIKKSVEDFSTMALREELKKQQVKDVKPDEAEVTRLYREAVREFRIRSVKFDKEEDARDAAAKMKEGGEFSAVVAPLVAAGKAQGGTEAEFINPRNLLPQIAEAVAAMNTGSVSAVIPVGPAFTILKVEEIRYPEGNAEAMEEAKQQALQHARVLALDKFRKELMAKYVKTKDKFLKGLDFESAKPGLEKLLTDKRVVAEIKGEKPVTVADVAETLTGRFFHGTDQAVKEKRVNEQKNPAFETILYERVYRKEALARGIDRSDNYRKAVEDYRNSLVFGMFVQKVIAPEIKLKEEEVVSYYNEHISEFSTPGVMRIESLAFAKKEAAEKGLAALRGGTEFQWLRANADGLADSSSDDVLKFDGSPVISTLLPEKIAAAVSGAKTGDARLYSSPEGYHYVLFVRDSVAPTPAPLEKERGIISKKVYNNRMNSAVEEWAEKLKKEYPVVIYATEVGA